MSKLVKYKLFMGDMLMQGQCFITNKRISYNFDFSKLDINFSWSCYGF